MIQFNIEMINQLKLRPNFSRQFKLEILSSMQHQGVPTILIDFTSSFFTAL